MLKSKINMKTDCGDCCKSNFPVNTDRNGIVNSNFSTNFQYGDIQAATYADFVSAVESLGGSVTLIPASAEGHHSFIEVCKLKACDFTYDWLDTATNLSERIEIKTNCSSCDQDSTEQCELKLLWTIETTPGVSYQEWNTSAIDTSNTVPSAEAFTLTNADGLPAHPNPADVDTTIATLVQPGNPSGIEQRCFRTWIYAPETVQLNEAGGYVETGEIYLGNCGGPLGLSKSWVGARPYDAGIFTTLSSGFHEIKVYTNDYSPDFSGLNIQWDLNGVFETIPAKYLALEKPTVKCRYVKICPDDTITELDGSLVTITDFDFWCEPNLCNTTDSGSISEMCFKSREDTFAVDNAGTQFGNIVQSITKIVGESAGEAFDLDFAVGDYTFQGTNGNNQTLSISNAINLALDDSEISHNVFGNAVATVGGKYLAWTSIAQVCPDFNLTQVQVTRTDGRVINLPIYRDIGELKYYTRRNCGGCAGGYEWLLGIEKVDAPEAGCLIPCGEEYKAIADPLPPTCDSSEPTVICYDTTGDGTADLSVYNIIDICTYEDGQEIEVKNYDLQTVADNPNDPDAWQLITVPAGAETLICDGARLIATDTLCDSEGTLHEIRTYELQGVTFQQTFIPGTNTQSTPVGILGDCGNLYPINVKTCTLDGLAKINYWDTNYVDITATDDYTVAFDTTDGFGMPAHSTPADFTGTTPYTRIWSGNTNGAGIPENATLEFYIVPDAGKSAQLRIVGAAIETGAVWLGNNQTDAVKILEWIRFTDHPNPSAVIGEIPAGCCTGKYIKLYYADDGPDNADVGVEWSLDGGLTWAKVPVSNISSVPPICETIVKWVSEGGSLSLGPTESIGECDCPEATDIEVPTIESISEIYVCQGSTTLVRKTIVDSEGRETIVFETSAGVVIKAPVSYTIGACNCAPTTYWKYTNEAPGSLETKWITTANQGNLTIAQAFPDVDPQGYPTNTATPDIVNQVNPQAATTNVVSSGTDSDSAQSDFYLFIPYTVNLAEQAGTAETVSVYVSQCGQTDMSEILNAPYTNFGLNPLGSFSPGCYRFRLYHHDYTANGTATLRIDDGDGTTSPIPASWISQIKFKEEEIKGWYCMGGIYMDNEGNPIDLTDDFTFCSPVTCPPVSSSSSTTTTPSQTIRIIS